MTIEEMRRRKEELGYTNVQLADISGVPLGTVQRVMSGETRNPRRDTWDALEAALADDKGVAYEYDQGHYGRADHVREIVTVYGKKQGEYTMDDYYAFPDDVRVELIDGVIYDMTPAPTTYHQLMADEIRMQIRECIQNCKRDCLVITAPDVQLDRDEKTMVQPDIALVCDREMVIGRCVYGAPDFIVEVLSDSTRKKDMVVKLKKYMEAGVQVYWMIDLKRRKLIAYDFNDELIPVIHGLEGKIIVKLYNKEVSEEDHETSQAGSDNSISECEIDFDRIMDYLGDLMEK